ncbi:F-box/LRR-repeat protein 5-like [Macrobrachium rosenbergii]|uniref:F-box/LRR-repeat protein 5-like n=1 Tax=Macrobrachium rosenbergii TaxID=79674 RepID=UPI0034D78A4C
MAPRNFPDEIDVFAGPHTRMKELVNIYTQKVQCLNFRDGREVISLLHDLGTTLYEFKSHESIENIFIMDQLKNRLKQRQIYNSAVCDCHNDNRLADVLQLVRTGTKVREQEMGERISFCQELQRAFEEFVENFLSHMEEEEQVFQPLLVEYFEYDELKILKDIVLKEHEHVKERHSLEKAHDEEPETCGVVKELRDLDWDLHCFSDESLEEASDYCSQFSRCQSVDETIPAETEDHYLEETCTELVVASSEGVEAPHLPAEILFKILRQLSPQDLGRCAQVCTSWNDAVYSPALWKAVYPVQWARGIWEWYDVGLCRALEDAAQQKLSNNFDRWDEDKDIDEAEEMRNPLAEKENFVLEELVNWVLPRVGHGVVTLVVDAGAGITSRLLHHAIALCPNMTFFSAAHTQVDYYLFKSLWLQGALQKLQHLDLQGCELIDDDALECLAQCAAPDNPYLAHDLDDREEELCPNEKFRNESWKVNTSDPVLKYCGYCTCWRANLVAPRSNSSYRNLYSKNRHRKPACLDLPDYKQHSSPYTLSHPRQECESWGLSSYPQSSSRQEALKAENDIEEICCRPGNHSLQNSSQWNSSCKKFTVSDSAEVLEYEKRQRNGHVLDTEGDNCRFQLLYLNLSGCWRVTDEGLLALVEAKAVDRLCHLDVSGCFQLSGEGLRMFAYDSRALKAENLFYCDNISDGPYPTRANGCANLCNPVRMCCRSGR